ncbi:oxidoreductase [Marinithermofilum abyssi]|uniref:Oxidoreductase n=1 Tax=Marinithermofilum abyssi TaxID=1571185 RepID=A0A8J2VDA6_9BACL|nr:SDR family oxidoreductase [Marinithermofilum abyssi]GGE07280.1 oxidoreductase [Marinithermofilum abyssi]
MSHTRVIAVTGGGQGIGRALVQHFAGEGARVYFLDVDEEAGREVEGEVRRSVFTRGDVSRESDVYKWMESIKQKEGKLDTLIHNAGIMIRRSVEELSLEEWNRVLDINLTGAFLTAKYGVPLLRKGDHPSILHIASTRALMSEADTESYSATKGGLLALTHALAISLGPAIRVNAVSPGWIDVTPWQKRSVREPEELTEQDHRQHPVGRVGNPEDIAKAVRFLTSPDADFITGANLVVDGGMTVKMIYAE